MAKKTDDQAKLAEAPADTGTAVAVTATEATAVSTDVSAAMLLQDGAEAQGMFQKDDLAVPFLRILQDLSPQKNKMKAEYIEGAEVGMFCNTVTQQIWPGKPGVVVVPVAYMPSYIEWWPRDSKLGKGLVHDYGADAAAVPATTRNAKGQEMTAQGTQIVRAGLYYALVVDEETGAASPVAISLSGTQLKKSRRWNTLISGVLVTDRASGKTFNPAPFYQSYRITAEYEENDQGNWFGWQIAPFKPTTALPNGSQLYLRAREFKALITGGKVTVVQDEPEGEGGAPTSGDLPF